MFEKLNFHPEIQPLVDEAKDAGVNWLDIVNVVLMHMGDIQQIIAKIKELIDDVKNA